MSGADNCCCCCSCTSAHDTRARGALIRRSYDPLFERLAALRCVSETHNVRPRLTGVCLSCESHQHEVRILLPTLLVRANE